MTKISCPDCEREKNPFAGKCDLHIRTPVTLDQYDRLSRRLYIVEQMTADWQKYSPSLAEMEAIGDRLHKMDKKISRIEKMFIKIGVKLFKKGIENETKA